MGFEELRNQNSIEEQPERMATTKPSRLQSISRVVRRAFPHIVLITVYLGYLVLGACVFCRLEHQIQAKEFLRARNHCKSAILDKMENMTNGNKTDDRTRGCRVGVKYMREMMLEELDNFEKTLMMPEWKAGRMETHIVDRSFTFASSMLFCMTTITTIGYGDIVPTTPAGRGFCIVYAMIGIPLTLLCLADIGDLLARLVLWFCKKVGINKCTRRITREFNRSQPQEDFSMPATAMTVKESPEHDNAQEMKHSPQSKGDDHGAATHHHQQHHSGHGVCTKDGTCQEEEVPIFVILVILVSYICGGSAIMVRIEGWQYGEAIYFTIITLTTIGFGDLIPTNLYSHHAFIFCIFFTLLGMAMMSMTITLLKDKVVRIVIFVYHKIKLEH
ncbi:TWiK family of potassium channels protein 7-like isoform X1 [Apostichopus japonicus]|uniref:TWiK family of potassium channels protein 7-like isoform X1 n=1 Tax=Stichopus japonicus TaxID=307972 RepID=UPI003AB2CCB4